METQENFSFSIKSCKKCTHCKEIKDLTEFNKDKCNKDGLGRWCRLCHLNNYNDNREARLEAKKLYRLNNREALRYRDKLYREKYREELINRNRLWRENNQEKIIEARQRPETKYSVYKCGARKKGRVFELDFETFVSLIVSKCEHCGSPGGGVDRLDSSQGYTVSNCAPSCTMCNLMKRHHPTEVFYQHALKIVKYQDLM